jgi:ribosomal protein L29
MTKKSQNLQSIRGLSPAAIEKKISESQKEYLKMKMEKAVQKGPKNLHAATQKRKEIAQLKTVQTILERTHV